MASTARCLAAAGDDRRAIEIVDELRANQERSYVAPVRVARVYVALKRSEDAFSWLERACVDRSIRNNMYLPYDYGFAALRDDPKFVTVLRNHLSL